MLHSCRSQLLLRTPTFLLLVYPAVQKSAPAGSGIQSNCATNRSPEWTATTMPSGNSVLTQVDLWLLLVVAEMSPFNTFKENNLLLFVVGQDYN